ncbi:tRNA (adenosine(37)-N6)-dimethylallyltransferase MiaA [Phenylobacterium sp.]|jgi:tRNA dimethylallyltransferase|uniref:tRNA (adenosine(37)-N6)-dimethylallyltransferase MiaA n=1 Tax=Phenylobacterium sp. TaxID=1871053 RepID=UPI002F3F07E8
MAPRIWLIAGPTASGKSALALRLAEAVGAEIVNADSMQLYADLRLLTARPSLEDEARAPHHLFGTVDAADGWSVGRWLKAAHAALEGIAARGRPAVVVGGTGLYFRALTLGLAEIPAIAADVRRAAAAEYEALGAEDFHARLAKIDPAAAARIPTTDRQRLARAWEVWAATGRSLSDWQADSALALPAGSWSAVALDPPREALYARCDARLAAMADQGVLAEVAALTARDLDPALPLMKAVGLREFAAHLRGEASLPEALSAAQQQTRNYAKRQATWMRGQMADWPRVGGIDADDQWGQFLALNPVLTP